MKIHETGLSVNFHEVEPAEYRDFSTRRVEFTYIKVVAIIVVCRAVDGFDS